jgi:hypothetical protein
LDSSAIMTRMPCVNCQAGIALVTAFATDGEHSWLTYRCKDCDHQFSRTSE